MPRRKLARRFEPRFGVSQPILDAEASYVARELEDYLVLSTNDLREKLSDMLAKVAIAQSGLQATFDRLPDRERLALKCMISRDVFHIAKLYETFIGTEAAPKQTGIARQLAPEELNSNNEPRPVLAFQKSLFD